MEVDIIPPMAAFMDCLAHASSVAAHPLQYPLMRLGLYPGRRRYRRNFDTLYKFHKGASRPPLCATPSAHGPVTLAVRCACIWNRQ